MQTEEQAPGTYHSQDFCNQVPRSKEREEVDFEENTTDALMENNITDQSNHKFEGFKNKDVEEILGEAEKNQTILGAQVYLHCKQFCCCLKALAVWIQLCFMCSN